MDPSTREEFSVNQPGEILLRGPNVMKGYFGKSSESEQAFEDGWFKTGNLDILGLFSFENFVGKLFQIF